MSENIITIDRPYSITGDIVKSSICSGGYPCGSVAQEQCSGGYPCKDGNEQTLDENIYKWPAGAEGTPLPDNRKKIPINCNLPKQNVGRLNTDEVIKLNDETIQQKTTDFWRIEIDTSPNRPVIIPENL